MYNTRVVSTVDRDLPVSHLCLDLTWDRLTSLLRSEVSKEAAALFAEPAPDPKLGVTHWLYVGTSDVVPFEKLPRDEQDLLIRRLARLQDAILQYADRLVSTGGDPEKRLAESLRAALATPDPQLHTWSAGGAPLLTAWGRGKAEMSLPQVRIVASQSVKQDGRTKGAHVDRLIDQPILSHSTFGKSVPFQRRLPLAPFLWFLFALIAASTFYRLVPACAVNIPLFLETLNYCPNVRGEALDALQRRNDYLRRSLRDEETRFADTQANCAPKDDNSQIPPDSRKAQQRLRDAAVKPSMFDVTLIWDGREDLDLHVFCPAGHIYFGDRTQCGGELDHDQNKSDAELVDHPVEHIAWNVRPPPGNYRVVVELFSNRNQSPRTIPFTIVVRDSAGERNLHGTIGPAPEKVEVTRLQF